MGQCRLFLMHDSSLLRENLNDASLMIVAKIQTVVYQYTKHD